MSHNKRWSSCGCLSFITLLAGCSNDTVNLGGGREPLVVQPGERCRSGSSIVQGPITVHDQRELDQLAGCEEIAGDLHIEVFAGADLKPLSALRTVDGLLELGAYPDQSRDLSGTEELMALAASVDQISADGYLSSLTGLEGLRRAGALQISYIAATDLEPLLGLRQLFSDGSVSIYSAQNLSDLHGLSNLQALSGLSVVNAPALTSLGGIALSRGAGISLTDSPSLSSLDELEPLDSLSGLSLSHLGIENLDSLANLGWVEGDIWLTGNSLLQNADGLARLTSARSFLVTNNDVLQSFPSLRNVSGLDSVVVVGNPALRNLQLDLHYEGAGPTTLRGSPLTNPITLIEIGQNDSLTELSLSVGLQHGRALAVYENVALTHVSFGALQRLEELDITGNANLEQVDVNSLQAVDQLLVVNNPKLDDAQLRALRTFSATVGRNATSP